VKKTLLLTAFLAAFLLFFPMLKQHGKEKKPVVLESFLENVEVVNKKAGEHQWSLLAKKVTISEDENIAKMHTVTVNLPRQGMTVKADSGSYNIDSKDLTLTGNIKAETDGYVVRTEQITLQSDKDELSAEDRVIIKGKRFRIEGTGLKVIQQKVRILSNVNAVFF
jgi:LPS export ABC transporter protein LptC